MTKMGYKPKWTQFHTDKVNEFLKKRNEGNQTFWTFKDPDDFIADLHDEPMITYGLHKDEYGNKHYYKFHKTNNCGGYVP